MEHFTKLFKPHEVRDSVEEQQHQLELSNLEKKRIFNELSFQTHPQEIELAIRNLKLGNAYGPHSITSQIINVPLFHTIFNYIFSNGSYPKSLTLQA